jgi:hypothetical protein
MCYEAGDVAELPERLAIHLLYRGFVKDAYKIFACR